MQTIRGEKVTWINLDKPSKDDLETIKQRYNLHPLVIEELSRSTFRARLEDYGDFLYLILHFPVYDLRDSTLGKEVDFIIGKDFLITAQYRKFPKFEAFLKNCTEDKVLREKYLSRGTAFLLYYLLLDLFDFVFSELDKMDKKITHVSVNIFKEHHSRKHGDLVRELSMLRREIIDFKRAIRPQEHIFMSFQTQGEEFFGTEFQPYLRNLFGMYMKVENTLENHKEVVDALHHTNTSLLSTRTTEITKNLTIMAFITFPLTLLANIFGMNTENNPIIGSPYDFWIIVAMMVAGIISMFEFFRYKKWL
ncbi:MAG: hypothetical protein A3C84_02125 [Candidatus Ryanbacteria bacterium RIFCSPHIGHO2_02_FULL_48_12]|uniref:Magnesium transporter CorA n=1 Tax=Candidatus Ryanbacteria bacterium RIFCSPHIGHO2_01_FULL_48_27 TaxID=1802115 RepID=A0A1G2G4A8_9BACT|nr:MAG: hypothetical protein A2756_04555 [Candidatus Ryanbacteria bacterium RIFCSPHIGHO2_01_FULL_48_27]OGZ49250.1 MAG: hypothetical protein A3C84_02125 [Candidatus Ryanbacteria bacterium RIFCSPHIGHO2_02_FULL_48_12]